MEKNISNTNISRSLGNKALQWLSEKGARRESLEICKAHKEKAIIGKKKEKKDQWNISSTLREHIVHGACV